MNRPPVLPALLVVLAAAPAQAGVRVASFTCVIGSGRTQVLLPRAREEDVNDELLCRATVAGIGGRSPRDLAVELRLLPPVGGYRVVATETLEPGSGRGLAAIDELAVSHATWLATVDWRDRVAPRVRLLLRVLDRPSPGTTRWRLLAQRRLDLGGHRATRVSSR